MNNLNQSIELYPSFYNQYFKAKIFLQKKDTSSAVISANNALNINESRANYLNKELRNEMYMILYHEKSNNAFNSPVAGVWDLEKNIGEKSIHDNYTNKVIYPITNIGSGILKLNNIQTSCNCVVTNVSNSNIPPGNTAFIEVQFHPNAQVGSFTHMINFNTNSPDSVIGLTLKGTFTK
jgi:hypothetical protein